MSDGGAWSARLARFQLAGAAIWWMVLFFNQSRSFDDSRWHAFTKPLTLPQEICLRTIIACNCSVVGKFPYNAYTMLCQLL